MSSSPTRVLVYGHDLALLETRRLLLEHAGFAVTIALDHRTATDLLTAQSFDLFILCHSLSLKDCEGALEFTRSLHPGVKNLILSTAVTGCSGDTGDATLSAFAGPRTLIETVNQLSSQTASSR